MIAGMLRVPDSPFDLKRSKRVACQVLVLFESPFRACEEPVLPSNSINSFIDLIRGDDAQFCILDLIRTAEGFKYAGQYNVLPPRANLNGCIYEAAKIYCPLSTATVDGKQQQAAA